MDTVIGALMGLILLVSSFAVSSILQCILEAMAPFLFSNWGGLLAEYRLGDISRRAHWHSATSF